MLAYTLAGLFFIWFAAMNYATKIPALQPDSDFFALWSYGRILTEQPAAELYDSDRLHDLEVALGMDPAQRKFFPYPPVFMLLVWPLGWLPLGLGYALFVGLTLAVFVGAAIAPRLRPIAILLLLASPATTMSVIVGQSGFLSGALLLGGLRLLGSRPWLSGVLFGLLTYKPQLGLLIPVALLAARAWRSIIAACATVLAIFIATSMLFGPSIWTAWLAALPHYSGQFTARSYLYYLQPTVISNLLMLGVPSAVATGAQILVGCAMAAATWIVFRRDAGPTAAAMLIGGTFLATSHAFFYDMPVVTGAVLLFAQARVRSGETLGWPVVLLLFLMLCLPALMVWTPMLMGSPPAWPISSPILLAFVWATVRFRQPGGANVPSARSLEPGARPS